MREAHAQHLGTIEPLPVSAAGEARTPGDASRRQAAAGGRPSSAIPQSARKRPSGTPMRCECGHPKSIHARMYANPQLGTPCNFPECRCKGYRMA